MSGSNLEQWTWLIGFFMPLLIAVVTKTNWKEKTKVWIAIASCFIAGVGTVFYADQYIDVEPMTIVLRIFVASAVSYKSFWKPLGATDSIEKNILG